MKKKSRLRNLLYLQARFFDIFCVTLIAIYTTSTNPCLELNEAKRRVLLVLCIMSCIEIVDRRKRLIYWILFNLDLDTTRLF